MTLSIKLCQPLILTRYWLDASRHLAATPSRLPSKLKLSDFCLCAHTVVKKKGVDEKNQTVKSTIENV